MEREEEFDQFQLLEEKVDSLIKQITSLRKGKEQLMEKIDIQEGKIEDLAGEVERLKGARDNAKQRVVSLLEKIEQLDIQSGGVTTLQEPVKVKILNQEYLIKSEEDTEEIYKVAEYVNEKLNEIKDNAEGLSEKKTAILAALNIASDYFQVLKERDDLSTNIRQRTKALIYNIDSVMG